MKLTKVRVENFKCIEDSTEFSINEVTCLIGKNEAGKTALLEALYKLKPVEADKANFDEEEVPRRHLTTYRERKEREPAKVLFTTWELEDDDVAAVEERIDPGTLGSKEIVVTKGYDNVTCWAIKLEEKKIIDRFLGEANLNAVEKAPLAKATSTQELLNKIEAIDSPTEKQAALLNAVRKVFPEGDAQTTAQKVLDERMPHFLYFSTYYQLPGRVGLNDLKKRQRENRLEFKHKVFLALLEMTSTGFEELETVIACRRRTGHAGGYPVGSPTILVIGTIVEDRFTIGCLADIKREWLFVPRHCVSPIQKYRTMEIIMQLNWLHKWLHEI